MGTSRFPTKDAEFNTYMQNVAPYLTSNATRLLIVAGIITQLGNLKTNWDSSYPQSQDANQRTGTIVDHKNESRRLLEELLRSIYKDIPDSILTAEDRRALNLPRRDATPTARAKITDVPITGLTPMPGAVIGFNCRSHTDTARPSMHPLSDAIEVQYAVGGTAPVNPAGCNRSFMSTRAKFNIPLDIADAGQKFHCYSRWVNLADRTKSSEWTSLMTVVITG